jgi:hypothetical protein
MHFILAIRAGALPRASRGGFLLFLLISRRQGTTDATDVLAGVGMGGGAENRKAAKERKEW